jgi:hypothetical protein
MVTVAAISALELAKSVLVGPGWMRIIPDECIPRKLKYSLADR